MTNPYIPSRLARVIPAGAFLQSLYVRSYEVGSDGHVSPATILRYLEQAATLASADRGFSHTWYRRQGTAWVVREMHLALGRLPGIDEELTIATWISDFRRVQSHREYALWRMPSGRLVARARGRWAYVDRQRGTPMRLSDELLNNFGVLGFPMPSLHVAPAVPASAVADASLRLTARGYEQDTQQHVNNCVYADWLDEASRGAADRADLDGMRLVPRALYLEYARPVRAGDIVRIETRIEALGTRALLATQEIRDETSNTLALQARTRFRVAARVPDLEPTP